MRIPELKMADVQILIRLLDLYRGDRHGIIRIKQKDLARDCKMCRRSVINSLARLEYRWLSIVRRQFDGKPNLYRPSVRLLHYLTREARYEKGSRPGRDGVYSIALAAAARRARPVAPNLAPAARPSGAQLTLNDRRHHGEGKKTFT